MAVSLVSRELSLASKRIAQVDLSHRFCTNMPVNTSSKHSSSNYQCAQPSKQSMSTNSGLLSSAPTSKRQVQMMTSMTSKRPVQRELPQKAQTGSLESVRSKLRESLLAALAAVSCQNNKQETTHKSYNGKESNASTLKQAKIHCPLDGLDIVAKNADAVFLNNNSIVEDELVQRHGLCWVSDVAAVTGEIGCRASKKRRIEDGKVTQDLRRAAVLNPETLAMEIELELFRLFAGVNKKYKEKGRSLLFNLKDRNNPELRERVMSGDIAPERLCSMTVEELASKELSQWRLAKAKELAQMVVLPVTNVDIRHLVKKTHKGEFHVEVENQDSVSMEVAFEPTVLSQIPAKLNEQEVQALEVSNHNGSLNEKTDLMRDLIADRLKGAELLPPIVSLEEFMNSADSEPSFENLPLDGEDSIHNSNEKVLYSLEPQKNSALNELGHKPDPTSDISYCKINSVQVKSKMILAKTFSVYPDTTAVSNPGKYEAKNANVDGLESYSSHAEIGISPSKNVVNGESIWEGTMQLNISSLMTVVGFFRSGEKTSTKDWPSLIEIKGRVRLESFEKFLQELQQSRSRAIMIAQFYWKEGSSWNDHLKLREVVNSYTADRRVGLAKPAPGVEVYLCPPNARTAEILQRHLPKEQTKSLCTDVHSLLGVIVWRRPTPISLGKHSSSRISRTVDPSRFSKKSLPTTSTQSYNTDEKGVKATAMAVSPDAGNEDDLPEFDFVNNQSHVSIRKPSQSHQPC